MKFSFFLFLLLLSITGFSQNPVYSYKVESISGGEIDFNDFHDKLIVVVNIASASERHVQLLQLDSLCRAYASSGVVVVAFPTNDFNKEPKSNPEIRDWVSGLHSNLKVSTLTLVKGETRSAFYNWCTKKLENGSLDMEVRGDFQKFIINRQGKMVGVFSGAVSPMSEPFRKAINANL
jgi:glutathione peroxidase